MASGQVDMGSCMWAMERSMVLEEVVVASLVVHKGLSTMAQGYNIVGLEMGKDKGREMEHLETEIKISVRITQLLDTATINRVVGIVQ